MSQVEERPGPRAIGATEGVGPMLERDYWAEVAGAGLNPESIGESLRARFVEFAPPETARFERIADPGRPLEVGDELDIRIALQGHCRVRVVHHDARSLTLRTLEGHPEAGKITFGADCDDRGRVVFRILSRTRASGWLSYLGYVVLGKQMQSRCWIRFIDRLARECGGQVRGRIYVRTRRVEASPADRLGHDEPTFRCEGRTREEGA
jgi:hypothetical protein